MFAADSLSAAAEGECRPQEIVFRHDFTHIQAIMKTLHPVDWRIARGVLD